MSTATTRIVREVIERKGWQPGTTLENQVAQILSSWGFHPDDIEQQYRVGVYRLDFAIPRIKVAIEADGWYHRSPEGAAKDAERDSWLRAEGWLILRVDDRHGEEALAEQLVWPARIIRREWRHAGIPNRST